MIEIEKFIPGSYADILEEIVCKSPEFQWVYTPSTNNEKETSILHKNASSYESDQFVHAIYLENARRSQLFDAERIIERQHRNAVAQRAERRHQLRTDRLCR